MGQLRGVRRKSVQYLRGHRSIFGGQSMSKVIVEQDEVFEYNVDVGYEENFEKWLRWNNRERRIYGEKEKTLEEAKKIFNSIYGGV